MLINYCNAVLQGRALVREALSSAAVVVAAVAALPAVPPATIALQLARGLCCAHLPDGGDALEVDPRHAAQPLTGGRASGGSSSGSCSVEHGDGGSNGCNENGAAVSGLLDDALRAAGSSWVAEMQRYSDTGRVCALKGTMNWAALPLACARLRRRGAPSASASATSNAINPPAAAAAAAATTLGGEQPATSCGNATGEAGSGPAYQPWHLLSDGVLAAACAALEGAPDAHFKFHAACVVNLCLGQIRDAIKWIAAGRKAAAAAGSDAAADGRSGDPAAMPAAAGDAAADAASAGGSDGAGGGTKADRGTAPKRLLQHQRAGASAVDAAAAERALLAAAAPPALSAAARSRLVALVWSNLEEPVSQTMRQVHEAFEALLDASALCHQHAAVLGACVEAIGLQCCHCWASVPCKMRHIAHALLRWRAIEPVAHNGLLCLLGGTVWL